MAIVIPEFNASNATIDVVFPGKKKPVAIPTSKSLTIGQLSTVVDSVGKGDLGAFIDIFPENVRPLLNELHPDQLNSFIGSWLASDETDASKAPKD